ncbi:unnamed protein product, partial [Phaeothamnion confervicola]
SSSDGVARGSGSVAGGTGTGGSGSGGRTGGAGGTTGGKDGTEISGVKDGKDRKSQAKATAAADGVLYRQCFTGAQAVAWMLRERVATCAAEAAALGERLLLLDLLEPVQPGVERFKNSAAHLYVIKELALVSLPATQVFPLLQRLCMAIVRAALDQEGRGRDAVIAVEVEDLHWADAGSLDMIMSMVKEGNSAGSGVGGLAFLLATRPVQAFPSHLRKRYAKLKAMRGVTLVALQPLGRDAMVEMAGAFLRVDELDVELQRLILSTCSGNPFFISEMCQSLVESRALTMKRVKNGGQRAVMKNVNRNAKAVPTSVQEIVSARIDTLEPSLALVLKVASVLGESFTFDLL